MQNQSWTIKQLAWAFFLAAGLSACAGIDQPDKPSDTGSIFPKHCTPTRQQDRIECVVQANKRVIDTVYRRYLRQTSGLTGRLVFALTIDTEGIAHAVRVELDQTKNTDFANDIAAVIKEMNFGPFDRNGVFRHAMDFYPD